MSILAATYFPGRLPRKYRRREWVSRPCSGWERVGHHRYDHQKAVQTQSVRIQCRRKASTYGADAYVRQCVYESGVRRVGRTKTWVGASGVKGRPRKTEVEREARAARLLRIVSNSASCMDDRHLCAACPFSYSIHLALSPRFPTSTPSVTNSLKKDR